MKIFRGRGGCFPMPLQAALLLATCAGCQCGEATDVGQRLVVTPDVLDFGAVEVTAQRTLHVTLRNVGDATLHASVNLTTQTSPAFSLPGLGESSSVSIAPSRSVDVDVAFAPTGPGSEAGELEIASDDPRLPTVLIPLSGALAGEGEGEGCQPEERAAAPFAGGDGSEAKPFRICTAAQLDAVRTHLDAQFLLEADLDLSALVFKPIGRTPDAFTGFFDGQGHTIAHFEFLDDAQDEVGLFGTISDSGGVANLALTDVNVAGRDNVGALAGRHVGYSFRGIVNVEVSGIIRGRDTVGGVVGDMQYGIIRNTSAAVDVSGSTNVGGIAGGVGYIGIVAGSTSSGTVTGDEAVGGVAGTVYGTTIPLSMIRSGSTSTVSGVTSVGGAVGANTGYSGIVECWASGFVQGTSQVGGLVGLNQQAVINAWSTAAVEGDSSVGGLVGLNSSFVAHSYAAGSVAGTNSVGGLVGAQSSGVAALVTAGFFDTQATGQQDSAGGATGLTTAEMMDPASFRLFNTYVVWRLAAGAYPAFRDAPVPCVSGAAAFGGGEGTTQSPFLIDSPDQLYHVSCNASSAFLLTKDLDLKGVRMPPPLGSTLTSDRLDGQDWGTGFSGTFDGGGHHISHWVHAGTVAGFIGVSGGATLVNLHLDHVDVTGTYNVAGARGTGTGPIRDVSVSGTIRGMYVASGLAANAYSSAIERCAVSADVIGQNSYIAGMVGYLGTGSTVVDSYATGSVRSDRLAAGFVGTGEGSVTRSYAANTLQSPTNFGFSYFYDGPATVADCYWNVDTSETASDGAARPALPLTTVQMHDAESFAGWDFSSTWQLLPGQFPTLR